MKILFLVNGLGLGNSTRCHAIIQRLAAFGAHIEIITSGNGHWYFEGRPEISRIHAIEALYYGSSEGRISIVRTILSMRDFYKIMRRNARAVDRVLDEFKPDVVVTDSVYTVRPMKKRGIPIVAFNNADVVHYSYRHFTDRPASIRAQFWVVEEMDYLFHRLFPRRVLSPCLDASIPQGHGNITRIGPIVRQGFSTSVAAGPVKRVLIMLSGSRFGSPVNLAAHAAYPFHIDVIGRSTPEDANLPSNIVFHGKLRDNAHIVEAADLVILNGGFSAVSEAFAMRKPMVVVPVPRHAEQWVNGRTIERLGVGFMAGEDTISQAMITAVARIDEFRDAYRRLESARDGAQEAADEIRRIAA